MEALPISEVAQQVGIRPSPIRYYESIHLLPPPRRVSGQRRYSSDIFERLSFIQTAQKLGFSIAEIQQLFHHQPTEEPFSDHWQTLANKKLAEVDLLIKQAVEMKRLLRKGLHCQCPNLNECINCVLVHCRERAAHQSDTGEDVRTALL